MYFDRRTPGTNTHTHIAAGNLNVQKMNLNVRLNAQLVTNKKGDRERIETNEKATTTITTTPRESIDCLAYSQIT